MKSPKSLSELFSENNLTNKLSLYRQKTSIFSDIHNLLSEIIGDNIAQNILVSNYKNSILYLETPSAAFATHFKTKQMEMLSQFRKQFDAGAVAIEIKVSPKSIKTNIPKFSQVEQVKEKSAEKSLPKEAVDIFTSIADSANGELKQKLLKLAAHKRK